MECGCNLGETVRGPCSAVICMYVCNMYDEISIHRLLVYICISQVLTQGFLCRCARVPVLTQGFLCRCARVCVLTPALNMQAALCRRPSPVLPTSFYIRGPCVEVELLFVASTDACLLCRSGCVFCKNLCCFYRCLSVV